MLTLEQIGAAQPISAPVKGDLSGKDVLSIEQFARADLEQFFEVTARMKRIVEQNGSTDILRGKILANLFYEASTRTDASFSIAMKRLGGEVHNIVGVQFSSVSKGETLEDTVRVLSGYADVIVLRHPERGAALRATQAIHRQRQKLSLPAVPLLNAGDGVGEHPSQALLDAYTIVQKFGQIQNITVALVGDLKHGRTVHSLAKLLSLYAQVKLILVSPPSLQMPSGLIDELRAKNITLQEVSSISDGAALREADVWYITRVQKERFDSQEAYQEVSGSYQVTAQTVAQMKPQAIIMHPLPRVGEISPEVDNLPQAVYFEQAANGMYVRMALLSGVLGKW